MQRSWPRKNTITGSSRTCRMKFCVLATLPLLAASCTTVSSSSCPPLIKYSKAQQEQVAQEIDTKGDEVPGMVGFIDDYGRTRAAIRKCHGE